MYVCVIMLEIRTHTHDHTCVVTLHLFVFLLSCFFVPSFLPSFLHSFLRSFIRSFIQSFNHSFIHSFTHSLTHSLVHPFTHSLSHSFIPLFLHSFIPSLEPLWSLLPAKSSPLLSAGWMCLPRGKPGVVWIASTSPSLPAWVLRPLALHAAWGESTLFFFVATLWRTTGPTKSIKIWRACSWTTWTVPFLGENYVQPHL